jgi:hypothetical protein
MKKLVSILMSIIKKFFIQSFFSFQKNSGTKTQMKSFYAFRGSWFEIFDKLAGILNPQNLQRFAIWESKSKIEGNLLIVYGLRITDKLQSINELEEITEPEFDTNYKSKIGDRKIHGYNEFSKINRGKLVV